MDAAIKGQSLTYQGVTLVLIGVLVTLLVWFAKVQLSKEVRLTDQLAKMSAEAMQVIKENTRVGEALKTNLEEVASGLKEIQKQLQEDRIERGRRTRGP